MNAGEFLRFASTLEEVRLETGVRRAGFRVVALDSGLEITPESSSLPRVIQAARIQLFLDEYQRSGAKSAGHYHDVTFDASYLLAVMAEHERVGA